VHPAGRLRAVGDEQERAFLNPLPMVLLPLDEDALRRLSFLGLRTLEQYATLPSGAVWQQFGRAGKLAHRCARGEDDRPSSLAGRGRSGWLKSSWKRHWPSRKGWRRR